MDPLSALSVAASVVQFVEFSGKVVGSAFELYSSVSGDLPKNLEIGKITSNLQVLVRELRSSRSQVGDATLNDLAGRALLLAEELTKMLDTLKVHHSGGFRSWAVLRAALRNVVKSSKVESLQTRLDRLRLSLIHI